MQLQIASVDGAYGSNLLAYAVEFGSVHGAYGSNLLAYTAHAVAKPCKIVCFASVDGAYSSKLLAYAVALC
jgi:hypothetical protein